MSLPTDHLNFVFTQPLKSLTDIGMKIMQFHSLEVKYLLSSCKYNFAFKTSISVCIIGKLMKYNCVCLCVADIATGENITEALVSEGLVEVRRGGLKLDEYELFLKHVPLMGIIKH